MKFSLILTLTVTGALNWSSYLGGAFDDNAYAVALDGAGGLLVGGSTKSFDFPVQGTRSSRPKA
jgi:hypothetical protein